MDEKQKCSYCEEPVERLRHPHVMGNIAVKICESCWEVDRETYKTTYNEDIGGF